MIPENSNPQFMVERPDKTIVPLNQFLSGEPSAAQKVQTLQTTYLTKINQVT